MLQGDLSTFIKGYSRKKYRGVGVGQQAIYFSMGGWCGKISNYMGHWCRPNLITWVVGISLRGRGNKNIICQKKESSLIKSSQNKALSLANRSGNGHFCLHAIVKPRMFPLIIGKKLYRNKLPNSGFCSGHYFTWETCIFRRIYSRKQR